MTASAYPSHMRRTWRKILMHRYCYLMLIPVAAYFIIFAYAPMWGIFISFQDYQIFLGIQGSPWVGLQNFRDFFGGLKFGQIFANTLILNIESIVIGFPAPIIFAIMMNEIKSRKLARTVQTITYMPHFISTVVVVSMMSMILSPTNGFVNQVIMRNGGEAIYFMNEAGWFRPLSIISGLWQNIGWNSIIYLAAITGIDPVYYEAAIIDGATWWQKIIHITIPSIKSTIIIMLILRLGNLLGTDFQKVLLMQTSGNKVVSEVLSTYVYARGIGNSEYGYAQAVSLFNGIVHIVLILITNTITNKLADEGLW